MKTFTKKPVLKKVRYKNGLDTFFTYSNWDTKEIEGVEYLAVVKKDPSNHETQMLHYVRKDAMEFIK